MHYFDFDADGILGAYNQLEIENDVKSGRQAIGVQHWVSVDTEGTMFSERPRVTVSLASPTTMYEFRDGIWRESDTAK